MEDRRMESSKNQSLHQNIYWIGNNCLKKSKRMRRQAIDGEKIFTKGSCDEGLLSKTYKKTS